MTSTHAYELGKYAALVRLHLKKTANISSYVLPALGGGALGAGTGALAAPQGQEMEGALLGAGIGAGAGAGGKALARHLPKLKSQSAVKSQAKLTDEAIESAGPFGVAHSKQAPEIKELGSAIEAAKPTETQELLGSGLGMAAGAGGAAGAASSINDKDEKPYPASVDPYGYSRYR